MKVIRKEDKNSYTYIKNYSDKDGELVFNMANGSHPRVLKTPSNEKRALQLMWNQQAKNEEEETKLENIITNCISLSKFFVVIAATALASTNLITSEAVNIGLRVLATINLSMIPLVEVPKIIKAKNDLKEIKKYDYLKNHEAVLNDQLDITNANHLENISTKSRKIIQEDTKKEETPSFTFNINTIDDISLKDLKTIRRNLARDQYFDFPDNTQKENSKVKTKSKNKKK